MEGANRSTIKTKKNKKKRRHTGKKVNITNIRMLQIHSTPQKSIQKDLTFGLHNRSPILFHFPSFLVTLSIFHILFCLYASSVHILTLFIIHILLSSACIMVLSTVSYTLTLYILCILLSSVCMPVLSTASYCILTLFILYILLSFVCMPVLSTVSYILFCLYAGSVHSVPHIHHTKLSAIH